MRCLQTSRISTGCGGPHMGLVCTYAGQHKEIVSLFLLLWIGGSSSMYFTCPLVLLGGMPVILAAFVVGKCRNDGQVYEESASPSPSPLLLFPSHVPTQQGRPGCHTMPFTSSGTGGLVRLGSTSTNANAVPHRHSYPPVVLAPATHPTASWTLLQHASQRQAELDEQRQAIEDDAASPSLSPLVAAAIKQGLLASLQKDREKTRMLMKGLLIDGDNDPSTRLEELRIAQTSQQDLLSHCREALANGPIVSQLEGFARDRNFPQECTSYCLDLGAASWVRIKTVQSNFALPVTSPLFKFFDGCTLEVTRQIALADLRAEGGDAGGARLYSLFQLPLAATILDVTLGPQERFLHLVLEIVVTPSQDGHSGGSAFRCACYGYRIFSPRSPASSYREAGAGNAPVKTWACTLPDPCQLPSRRHLLGLSVPVSQSSFSGPLEVMVSVAV